MHFQKRQKNNLKIYTDFCEILHYDIFLVGRKLLTKKNEISMHMIFNEVGGSVDF